MGAEDRSGRPGGKSGLVVGYIVGETGHCKLRLSKRRFGSDELHESWCECVLLIGRFSPSLTSSQLLPVNLVFFHIVTSLSIPVERALRKFGFGKAWES